MLYKVAGKFQHRKLIIGQVSVQVFSKAIKILSVTIQ